MHTEAGGIFCVDYQMKIPKEHSHTAIKQKEENLKSKHLNIETAQVPLSRVLIGCVVCLEVFDSPNCALKSYMPPKRQKLQLLSISN